MIFFVFVLYDMKRRHLGHNKDNDCLPGGGNAGFDFFYGLPYSHEEGYPGPMPEGLVFPPVPLMTNAYGFIEQPFNGSDLTSRYTALAERMIDLFAQGQSEAALLRSSSSSSNSSAATSQPLLPNLLDEEKSLFGDLSFSKPFFLHVAYENPHVPLFLSDDYQPRSRRGLFGDSVEEMDQSIGRIMAALERGSLLSNTMVIFSSDNGAWVNPNNGLNSNRQTKGMG
jgi:arylsulfatase A-like enzyme